MSISPKALLDNHGVQPKKSLGQNFMHDPKTLEKIVAAAAVQTGDVVVEVGAGAGALTQALADAGAQVYAIEVDERLRPILEERFDDHDQVYLVFADILKTDIPTLVGDADYLVVANVPYYISSAILWHFLESRRPPLRMLLTMQYEVAERVISAPGAMNLLAIAVQFHGAPRIVSKLSPAVFWPRPHIQSAIVRIDTHADKPVDVPSAPAFFRVVRAGFSQKRKQLRNALAGGLGVKARAAAELLRAADIEPQRRAETLTLEEWARLTRTLAQSERAL
ncbi:MAG: 16S rRNA (adenine(1518)-N(6)/adenine(1519)-N(6))-dimethyltransferase RsmA [Chloroflexi bacterium]|nr:16S rRNA (adenine(1518)-N(6)/adenine(1519)-N(6))-dimethyltransferase RsmA [Chloroflexota bacterium]